MKFCKTCGQRLENNEACKKCTPPSTIPDETVLLTSNPTDTPNTNNSSQSELLFDRYQIVSILGKGGMGTVYLAKDVRLDGKLWAIKETVMSPDDYQEFVDEAKMLVSLEHSNLPKIVDYYPPNEMGQTYLVMDYIKGRTLSEIFEEAGNSLPYQRVIKYAIQLCNLLDYLHNLKPTPIIYRDLKPSNVMIDDKDNVQLIDFGIARKYKVGKQSDTVQMGTIGFAAPEQFENMQTDQRTDLFSLGAMIYYLLSGGRFIYSTGQPLYTLNKEVPLELSSVVQKLVKINPNERYQDTKLLKQDLTKLRVTGKIPPSPTTVPIQPIVKKEVVTAPIKPLQKADKKPKKSKWKRKLKIWSYVSLFLIIIGLGAFGAYTYMVYQNNVEHTIAKFENAIIDQDTKALTDLFTSSDNRLQIGEKEVSFFLEYLDKNPAHLSPMIASLEEKSEVSAIIDGEVQEAEEVESEPILSIKKSGKKYMVIDTYKIEVHPQFLTIKTNQQNTSFYISDKEIARSDAEDFSRNIGPLMPGLYNIKGVWEAEHVNLENEQTVELFGGTELEEGLTFEFEGQTINIDSNYQDAKLFVNSKDTGLTIEKVNPFGPIVTDGTLNVLAEISFPWGNARSEEVTISSEDNLTLDINPLTEELEQTLMDMGNEYAQSFIAAYSSGDVNQFKHLDKNMMSTYSTELQNNKATNTTWKGSLVATNFDLDSFSIEQNNLNEHEVSVNTSFQYNLAISTPDNQPEAALTDFNQAITFKYSNNISKWVISHAEQIGSVGGNIKEFSFAN